MNEDSRAVAESYDYTVSEYVAPEPRLAAVDHAPPIPDYLQDTYWWAYLHPKALHFFEREWVVNLILWGNMRKLTQAVLDELNVQPNSRVLQVACVYGEFSSLLAGHLAIQRIEARPGRRGADPAEERPRETRRRTRTSFSTTRIPAH